MRAAEVPWWEGHPDLLPPEPDLEPLHAREYSVRAYQLSDDAMLLRGAVMDIRPGGPVAARIEAVGGTDDGRPLPLHHMIIDLTVSSTAAFADASSSRFEVSEDL